MRKSVVLASLVVSLVVACKSKSSTTEGTSTGSGSGSAVAAGSGSGSANPNDKPGMPVPTKKDVTLPTPSGQPPKKTTTKLDQAAVDRLEKLEFPTFETEDRSAGTTFEVRHYTPRPKLAVTVTVAPCFDCKPMKKEDWMLKKAALMNLLHQSLRDHPDTTWELGETELNGTKMIYIYQFGYSEGKDSTGNPETAFANAYMLWFNDGTNQIRVVAEYKDEWIAKADLLQVAPREDLEKLARTFMDVYTQAW